MPLVQLSYPKSSESSGGSWSAGLFLPFETNGVSSERMVVNGYKAVYVTLINKK